MSDLPRYAIFGKSAIDPSADIVVMTGCDGEWVRYSDAAAKTAALQAKVTRYEESTRLAEAHLTLTLTQLAEAQAECARLRERLDTASSANSELYGACSRQVKNIEAWLETGEPAGPDESKSIYEQLCKAIDRCPMDIDAALRGKETE